MKPTTLILMLLLSIASVSAVNYQVYTQTDSRIPQDVTSYDKLTVAVNKELPIDGVLYGYLDNRYGSPELVYKKYDGTFKPYLIVLDVQYNYRTGAPASWPARGSAHKVIKPVSVETPSGPTPDPYVPPHNGGKERHICV
jgi:hypothetical protein